PLPALFAFPRSSIGHPPWTYLVDGRSAWAPRALLTLRRRLQPSSSSQFRGKSQRVPPDEVQCRLRRQPAHLLPASLELEPIRFGSAVERAGDVDEAHRLRLAAAAGARDA